MPGGTTCRRRIGACVGGRWGCWRGGCDEGRRRSQDHPSPPLGSDECGTSVEERWRLYALHHGDQHATRKCHPSEHAPGNRFAPRREIVKYLSYLLADAVRKTPLTQIDTSMPSSQGSLNALIGNHIHPQIEELV